MDIVSLVCLMLCIWHLETEQQSIVLSTDSSGFDSEEGLFTYYQLAMTFMGKYEQERIDEATDYWWCQEEVGHISWLTFQLISVVKSNTVIPNRVIGFLH